MAELRANGGEIPILFPITEEGFASISAQYLSVRFGFSIDSILIEREIYDPISSLVSMTIPVKSSTTSGTTVWKLGAGKYNVYGLPVSQVGACNPLFIPLRSSTSTRNTPHAVKIEKAVKIEATVPIIVDLSDSSDEDATPLQTPLVKPIHHSPSPILPSHSPSQVTLPFSPTNIVSPTVPTSSKPRHSIVQLLRKLVSMPGSKNILKKLDYDQLKIEEVDYLPPRFDGPCMFVLPPTTVSASLTKAKSMEGMDKRYDGHVWTKTQTTNISNELGLVFRTSTCVGHLECRNSNCDFLQCPNRSSKVNDTEFDGFTKFPFSINSPPPSGLNSCM